MPRAKYTLTRYLRSRLKRPMGEFFSPDDVNTARFTASFSTSPLVVTVGDRVTDTLAEFGRVPDIQVIDMMERRQERTRASQAPYSTLIRVRNPAGGLTAQAVSAVRRAFGEKNRPVRILVVGEEDLMTIPVLLFAPIGSAVYYGQPGKGVVMVRADGTSSGRARRTLDLMKEKGSANSKHTAARIDRRSSSSLSQGKSNRSLARSRTIRR